MSQDDRLSDSPPSTYPLDTDQTNYGYFTSQNIELENSSFWGRLMPVSTNLKCSVFDLEHDIYLFGRLASCEFVFSKANTGEENIKIVSKLHFKISRNLHTTMYVVYVEDMSSNGTFINGEKIGKGRKVPLKNNDVIALALPHFQVFVYMDLRIEDDEKYPPEIKNRYTVTRELGRGSCGKVKLVFEKDTCKMLAMKIIQKSKTSSGGINDPKKIKSEVKILRSLNHPCIIRIEDFLDTPDECFIILTLAEGGDLMKYIQDKQRLSEKETRKIFYQIVLAIQYLHSSGIAHRDLKPQNVLLTGRGRDLMIKVTDFGLSKTIESSGSAISLHGSWSNCEIGNGLMKTVCGSPLYVAPEVLAAAINSSKYSGYTKKVDIWSMGVILYLCLSGHTPFLNMYPNSDVSNGEVSNSEESYVKIRCTLQAAILKGNYSFPDDLWKGVSEEAKDLITKMLTVNPEKRITLMQILDHPWLQDISMKERVHSLMCSQSSIHSEILSENSDDGDDDYIPDLKKQRLKSDET